MRVPDIAKLVQPFTDRPFEIATAKTPVTNDAITIKGTDINPQKGIGINTVNPIEISPSNCPGLRAGGNKVL
jgi:hypothetical protein